MPEIVTIEIEREPGLTRIEAQTLAIRIDRGYLDYQKIRDLTISERALIVAALEAYGQYE